MKRLLDLTVEDLAAHRVWRYEAGVGEEATVAPVKRDSLSQSDDEIFLAATEFELVDRSRHSGFCFPADDSGIDYLQPVIVSPTGHAAFWIDGQVTTEMLSMRWRTLGKTPEQIFPVVFRCLVPVDGRTVGGSIAAVESSQNQNAVVESPPGPGAQARDEAVFSRAEGVPRARPIQTRRGTRGAVEKRTARRRRAEMTVEFTQDAVPATGTIGNISRRGMFVHAARPPGAGPLLRLKVNLPDGRELVLTGRVVRSAGGESPSGFGLRLADDWPNYENLFPRSRDKP